MVAIDEAVALLKRGPATMRALYTDLPDAWLQASVGEEWSAHSVLIHMLATEGSAWIDRIEHILAAPGTPTPPFDRGEPDASRDVGQMLDEFEELRQSNLQRLARVDMKTEVGIHPVLGEITTDQVLAAWTVHDLNHQAQAMAAIASRYRTDVGPFIPNLGILGPAD